MISAHPRILVHHDKPEPVIETLARRIGDAAVASCADYASLPRILDAFAPNILFSVRFDGTPRFPRAAIAAALSLRWIAVAGSGTDHLGDWDPRKVVVTNAAGVGAAVMAEFVVGCIYAFAMQLPSFAQQQAKRNWRQRDLRPVAGSTLLVVGLGHVGRAIAALARRNGMRVLAIRARSGVSQDVDECGTSVDLPRYAAVSDYMAVATPLTDATRGLIDRAVIAALPRHAVIINVARGGVVDEEALAAALDAGQLGGAALDVFETEPLPPDHSLWRHPGVLVTPHNAAVFADWIRLAAECFCDNLANWRRGLPLQNVVAPSARPR
jgi:phosphoglycerate dehydrogenase-like enzyme